MNPFIHLFDAPVETLTAAAYVVVLIGALGASWYALGLNLLALREGWQDGWKYLIPLAYAVRVVATTIVVAVDLLLIAAIIRVI
jgi:hypothetical protein